MKAKTTLAALAAMAAGLLTAASAGTAMAGPPAGGCCQTPPPPPKPPSCCHNVNVPGVNVHVAPTVVVNAQANAVANVNASASAGAAGGAGAVYFGGGGGSFYAGPGAINMIGGLNVQGGGVKRTAYEASRSSTKKVVIRAFCLDDRETPHPASQVFPGKDVREGYDGELFRCIAGTRLQATVVEWSENGRYDVACFNKDGYAGSDLSKCDVGRVVACAKGEALYKSGKGELVCRPQKPARDCNERSLLRRYGAGIKVVTIVTTEKYMAYKEEATTETHAAGSFTMDGGVGGVVF